MNEAVRTFRIENELAKKIDAPGGITVAEALAAAEAGVEQLRAECLSALDQKIGEIDAIAQPGAFRASPAELARIYRLANEILGEAGALGLHELSEAGRSLCELASRWVRARLDAEPIRLHAAAMKSLRRPHVAGAPELRAAVLAGLREITVRLSAPGRCAS